MPHMRFAQPRSGLPVTLTVAPWLLHGWPGSFHEFGRAAERLRAGTSDTPGFNLVVPSLPGFAFSDAPQNPGVNPALVGLHLNFIPGQPPPPDGVEPSAKERAYQEFRANFQATETGYSAIQLTRPQSLA